MILADKIISLRKRNGWTQEALAEKLNVSRQAVSKWEGAQSMPDMEKILQMSRLFEVSVDYLMKEELVESDYVEDTYSSVKKVSLELANAFIKDSIWQAKRIAIAVGLFIISPVVLIGFSLLDEAGKLSITEQQYGILGLVFLILMVVVGVAILIYTNATMSQYDFIEESIFDIEFGVEGMVEDAKRRYRPTHTLGLVVGVSLLILSSLPVLLSDVFEIFEVIGVPILLIMVALGVNTLIRVSVLWSSFEKLMQEGEYNPRTKQDSEIMGVVASIYWPTVVAIYLLWSFLRNDWGISWIIFPVAGALFGSIAAFVNYKNR